MFNWWIRRKLESSDPEKRKSALEQLVKSGTFQPLMAVLKNPTLRDEAISEFSKLGRTAEDFLNAASSHQDIEVKAGAILAFGRMRNSRAADLLAELIQTSSASKQDRLEAIQLLSKTSGGPGAVAALQTVLNNQNGDLRTEATLGLGRIGESAAVEPLIDLVANRQMNSKARSEAAILLGNLKDTRATDVLKSLLDEDSPVKDAAIGALGALGILEPLIQLLSEHNVEAVEALGRSKAPLAVQPLIEALQNGDRKWQEQVIKALGRTEDARALEAVYQSLGIYNDTEWKLTVADALGRDNRAVEIIVELIKEQMRLAYGYDRDWAAAAKSRIATLVDLLGKIRNPLAHEFIGNLVDKERNDLERLMNANDFMHHYESLKLLKSSVKALGEVGNTDDFSTLNLVSIQLEGYRRAILNSQRGHAWTKEKSITG